MQIKNGKVNGYLVFTMYIAGRMLPLLVLGKMQIQEIMKRFAYQYSVLYRV